MRSAAALVALSVIALVFTRPVEAQFRQYKPPGGASPVREEAGQRIDQALENARWRLGPLRLAPWLGLRQVAWVDNVYSGSGEGEDVSDVTATVGAGLTAYLPTGPKVLWVAEALPEYVWWQDLDERRQLVGRYGAGVLADFNRLQLEASARSQEQDRVVSEEFPQQVLQRTRSFDLGAELGLTGRIGLFGGAGLTELEDRSAELADPRLPPFRRLDREESHASAGVAYYPTDRWRLAVGVERAEVEFEPGARNLSTDGTYPVLEARYTGARVALELAGALYSADPAPGSDFPGYEEPGGELHLRTGLGWRTEVELYGHRQPVFSLASDYAYYDSRRTGSALGIELHRRLTLRVFGETGENVYEPLTAAAPRSDDVTAFGGELSIEITRSLTVGIGYRQEEFDSSLPGLDREVGSLLSWARFNPTFLQWE